VLVESDDPSGDHHVCSHARAIDVLAGHRIRASIAFPGTKGNEATTEASPTESAMRSSLR
jgi:hypothetical protein